MAQEGCQGYTRARYNRAAAVTRSCFLHGPLESEPWEPGLAAVNGLSVWEGGRGIKCGCYGTLRGEEGGGGVAYVLCAGPAHHLGDGSMKRHLLRAAVPSSLWALRRAWQR